jgi:hypothetical protein
MMRQSAGKSKCRLISIIMASRGLIVGPAIARALPFIFIGLTICGCASNYDSRLVGTFVSDKDETMAYLKSAGKFTERQLSVYSRLLGKLRIECDGVTEVSIMEDFTDSQPLRVIERTSEYVVTESEVLGYKVQHKIIFTEDGYWVTGGLTGPDYREKFKRLDTSTKKQSIPENVTNK